MCQSILSLWSMILLVGRGITPEKFMNAILTEGLFEAYLELRAQMIEAARAKKQISPAANKQHAQ